MDTRNIWVILNKDFRANIWLWALLSLHLLMSISGLFGQHDLIGSFDLLLIWGLLPIVSNQFFLEENAPTAQLKFNYLRAIAVFSPVLVLGSVMPLLGQFDVQHFDFWTWIFYYLGLVTTIGLLVQWKVWASIDWQKIIQRYWNPKDSTIWLEIVGIIGMGAVFEWSWELLVFKESPSTFVPEGVDTLLRRVHFSQIFFGSSLAALIVWVSYSFRR